VAGKKILFFLKKGFAILGWGILNLNLFYGFGFGEITGDFFIFFFFFFFGTMEKKKGGDGGKGRVFFSFLFLYKGKKRGKKCLGFFKKEKKKRGSFKWWWGNKHLKWFGRLRNSGSRGKNFLKKNRRNKK
ncbi:hypothetical protein, partial [Enterococcus faecalis]|uniref:hypothetical protein n=1 Tax=Enterococcus faecalis TaxID=1351 RepID=UPI001BAA7948